MSIVVLVEFGEDMNEPISIEYNDLLGEAVMSDHKNHPFYAALNAKLAEIAEASPAPPTWVEAWSRLGPDSSEEERLAVYQSIRCSGCLPAEAGFFLVSWQLDAVTLAYADEALRAHDARFEAVRRKLGLGEDDRLSGKAPPEYVEARRQLHDAWDALYAAKMAEFGEPEMARLFREDRPEFQRRSEAGRQFFHGPDKDGEDPAWFENLLGAVAACVAPAGPMGPLGMRYRAEDGFWEIWIYPTPVELVGGRHDGEVVVPGFTFNLEQFRSTFDAIEDFGWNSLGMDADDGPQVYIEGEFQGRKVFVQVQAQPPEGEEPGLKFDTTRKP